MHAIDPAPLWPWINGAAAILLGGIAVYLASYLKSMLASRTAFLDKSTEALIAQTIDGALKAGVLYAMNFIKTEEDSVGPVKTDSWIAATAAQYAIDHAPQAAAHFGLDLDALAEMAVARLPTVKTTEGTTGATAPIVPVSSGLLPPVNIRRPQV